jgi:hypothetical protein
MTRIMLVLTLLLIVSVAGVAVSADDKQEKQEGAYLVVEGNVKHISARSLVINDRQYPISKFAQVYMKVEKGEEIPLHTVVNVGKIDKARLYLLGGKVEKIIVLKNI